MLPQFMILLYEREVPDTIAAASPALLQAYMSLPRQIAETGGRFVSGHAVQSAGSGVSIRGNEVVGGSLAGEAGQFAGYLIVEASDFDHAVWIGRMVPVADGWVEVRPLVTS